MRGSGGEIGASIAASRENDLLGAEAVDRTVVHLHADDAAATVVLVHDQVDGKIFDEELGLVTQRLPIKRMQDGVAGAVRRRTGAQRLAFAVIRGHAAKRALVDLARFRAREGHAPMLELIDGSRRIAAQIFDRVLVTEPVGALDGVIHVPAPVVSAHIAERCGNAALRRHRMRTGREDLRDAGGAQSSL